MGFRALPYFCITTMLVTSGSTRRCVHACRRRPSERGWRGVDDDASSAKRGRGGEGGHAYINPKTH